MLSSASNFFGLWSKEPVIYEEPPKHLLDSLDFVDSSDEEEIDKDDGEIIPDENCPESENYEDSSKLELKPQKLYKRYSHFNFKHIVRTSSKS